ncbi:MAG: thiamine pyrophosphate-binding protein [Nocardioidaceae bacterium]
MTADRVRTGGDLVVEALSALGASTVFGLPGQHALAAFDALRRRELRYAGFRTETGAAFAADGYARTTGTVAPLLVSTGPGALFTLPALHEARSASVPVLGISSQVPSAGLGGRRRGFLHELPDQAASFRDVVKHVESARTSSQIPGALAAAWEVASSPPYGPAWVEIPQDVLIGAVDVPPVGELDVAPKRPVPRGELLDEAARLLDSARRPAVLAGGGVIRAGGADALRALAERLQAPVATTFGGKGAFGWDHPLSLQSWLEDSYLTDFLAAADVLLVIGSGLGELSSNFHTLRPQGHLIQIDADRGKLGSNHPGLGIQADAREACESLIGRVGERAPDSEVVSGVAEVVSRVRERVGAQDLGLERDVLRSVRDAVPDDVPTFWDMTILGYWAWSAWDPRGPGLMHSAQGAGGLGYAYPAALGAAAAGASPVLAVSGDGGAMYGLAELATARQLELDVTWLVVDDGGYGILREYMERAFEATTATELVRPDFVALAESFGVPAVSTTPASLRSDLGEALGSPGPRVVVLPQHLRMFAPTHS